MPNYRPSCIDTTSISALCDHIQVTNCSQHDKVPKIVTELLSSWSTKECYEHISPVSIPSQEKIIEIVEQAKRILFPGFFSNTKLHASNLEYYIGKKTTDLYDKVSEQITMAIRHDCRRNDRPCINCEAQSHKIALAFIESLPKVAAILATDIRAALTGDPATKSPDEVIFCYPGLLATVIFRLAHELYLLNVPIIPRIMTEYAHSLTGIDIHPGASSVMVFLSIMVLVWSLGKLLLSEIMCVFIRGLPWEPCLFPVMQVKSCEIKNAIQP